MPWNDKSSVLGHVNLEQPKALPKIKLEKEESQNILDLHYENIMAESKLEQAKKKKDKK